MDVKERECVGVEGDKVCKVDNGYGGGERRVSDQGKKKKKKRKREKKGVQCVI